MDEPFDWNWLISIGFAQLDGAAQGVLILNEKNISLICFPEFIDNCLGDAHWVFNNGRHNSIPSFLAPKTKNDVFWLLKKLKLRE